MAKQLAFRVVNARTGLNWCRMVADLAIGYQDDSGAFVGLFEVRGCVLKNGQKGAYVQFPSKPRIKNGEHQTDDEGRPIYDSTFDLYMELGAGNDPEKRAPTEKAWEARRYVIELFETAEQGASAETSGRGGARKAAASPPRSGTPRTAPPKPPAPKAAPAMAQTTIDDDEAGSPLGDDDDLPF